MLSKSAFLIGDLPALQVAHLVGMAVLDELRPPEIRGGVRDKFNSTAPFHENAQSQS